MTTEQLAHVTPHTRTRIKHTYTYTNMQAKAAGDDYRTARTRHAPLTSQGRADTHMGYVSETFEDLVDSYLDKYAGTPGG